MKQLGKLFLIFTILVSATMFYINPDANAKQEDQWDKIKERGELRVGLSADYAPFEFKHNV
ncbi:glutamate ABC transporter permease, partial [Staphylococcus succinus]